MICQLGIELQRKQEQREGRGGETGYDGSDYLSEEEPLNTHWGQRIDSLRDNTGVSLIAESREQRQVLMPSVSELASH